MKKALFTILSLISFAALAAGPQAPASRVTNSTAASKVPTTMPATGSGTVATKGKPTAPVGVGHGGTTPSGVSKK